MMKRIVANTLFFLVIVGGVCVPRLCRRTLPESECGEVYQRYAHHEGVEATFVKGFPVNDTVSVDVTLLRAADSAGWECLLDAFHIPPALIHIAQADPNSDLFQWQSPRGSPETRAMVKGPHRDPNLTKDDLEVCACSFSRREVCIFHTGNAKEVEAIEKYNFDNMMDNKQH